MLGTSTKTIESERSRQAGIEVGGTENLSGTCPYCGDVSVMQMTDAGIIMCPCPQEG